MFAEYPARTGNRDSAQPDQPGVYWLNPYPQRVTHLFSGLQVDAVQLGPANLRRIGHWIKTNGGAVAGMSIRDWGPVPLRGILIGGLGGFDEALVGDWVIRTVIGDFISVPRAAFARLYDV